MYEDNIGLLLQNTNAKKRFFLSFSDLFTINVSIGQCHGRVMLVHRLTREATNQVGLGAVRERKRVRQFIEWLGADWTLTVEFL